MEKKRKIIEIKPQVRNSSRRTIVFDDGSVFGLSEDVLLLSKLGVGDEISDADLERISDREDTSKVMTAALRLLEFRMRSISEMRQRLKQKQHHSDKVEQVIAKLVEMEYLDDDKFSLSFARDKVRSRKIGPVLLKQELGKHRLGTDKIESTIQRVYQEFSVHDMIVQHIQKKMPHPEGGKEKELKKLQLFLQRKGFTWDQIREHLTDIKERISRNE